MKTLRTFYKPLAAITVLLGTAQLSFAGGIKGPLFDTEELIGFGLLFLAIVGTIIGTLIGTIRAATKQEQPKGRLYIGGILSLVVGAIALSIIPGLGLFPIGVAGAAIGVAVYKSFKYNSVQY